MKTAILETPLKKSMTETNTRLVTQTVLDISYIFD